MAARSTENVSYEARRRSKHCMLGQFQKVKKGRRQERVTGVKKSWAQNCGVFWRRILRFTNGHNQILLAFQPWILVCSLLIVLFSWLIESWSGNTTLFFFSEIWLLWIFSKKLKCSGLQGPAATGEVKVTPNEECIRSCWVNNDAMVCYLLQGIEKTRKGNTVRQNEEAESEFGSLQLANTSWLPDTKDSDEQETETGNSTNPNNRVDVRESGSKSKRRKEEKSVWL